MNIICWNCRGAGGKSFHSLIRDMQKEYDANFIILLETHVSGMKGKKIRDKMGFDGSFIVEAVGHSGDYSSSLMDFLDVSEDMVKKIAAISPPSPWRMPDHVAWNLWLLYGTN
ncbi:hypothetical protein Ahy_B06g081431 isoform A [Arachis hypogaea]|uniref:Endonuclease/exonuclease/phosphatase domain-containing protein n=1 Tax=Arachis hypogaea TaxID=3818 RepID=A0A444YL35_ARAHY|nr:hypothetical protein Ahy_B06g081431 isoform A [Arachis hypogaea]